MAEEHSEYVAAVRVEIDKQLGWTPQQVHAEAWDHAVTIALGVVGPILDSWEQRLGDVREEYRKSLESWERSRQRLDATIEQLRTDWRESDQEHTRSGELLAWLHAEAAWHREQLDDEALKWTEVAGNYAEEIEALRAESANRLEVGDRLGWRLVEAREEVRALKAAIADIDAHATPVGLLHNDDPEGSPHHYLLTVGALHRALGKAYTAEPCESERARLRVEVARSRREVKFEALGANTFSGADAVAEHGRAVPEGRLCDECLGGRTSLIDLHVGHGIPDLHGGEEPEVWVEAPDDEGQPQCAVHPEGAAGTPIQGGDR